MPAVADITCARMRPLLAGGDAQILVLEEAPPPLEERIESSGLICAHERLFDELDVRYLDCEGGAVALAAFRRAGILDEIFVTVTDIHIEPSEHEGVRRILPLEPGPARLVAEGRTASDAGYLFQRWRLNAR